MVYFKEMGVMFIMFEMLFNFRILEFVFLEYKVLYVKYEMVVEREYVKVV